MGKLGGKKYDVKSRLGGARAQRGSGTFDLKRATEMAFASTLVYQGSVWQSKKAKKGRGTCALELPLTVRFLSGLLGRTGGIGHKYGLALLDPAFDTQVGPTQMRDGIITSSETDTNAMVLVHEEDRYAVLAFRGTETRPTDVLTDLKFRRITMDPGVVPHAGTVHRGFAAAFTSVAPLLYATLNTLFPPKDGGGGYQRLFVTGHSLGGALATLAARGIAAHCPGVPAVTVYTFGSPMVGSDAFGVDYDASIPDTYRCVNDQDLVACLPPPALGYGPVGRTHFLN